MRWMRTALALTTAFAMAACGEDTSPTQPPATDQDATVQGRVESTQPEPTGSPTGAMWASADGGASTVAVAEMTSNGSLRTVAEGRVEADGSFSVDSVPADRANLVVVAKNSSGTIVGRTMLHERTRANAVVTAAPINHETSLEALAYAEMKADGEASMSSPSEVALLVHSRSDAAASIIASGNARVVADGVYTASDAMTRVYAQTGTSFDASARAEAFAQATIDYANARYSGTSAEVAHETFVNATMDATANAGVSMDAMTTATAAAASTMDARLSGHIAARGDVVAQAVRLNLKARKRLAAQFQSGAEGDLAVSVMSSLNEAEAKLASTTTAAHIRSTLDAQAQAAVEATVSGMVDLLVPNASLILKSDVETKARAAMEAARLSVRLQAAADAQAAAQATAEYRASVRAAVQAMLEASGRTDLSVESMTSLYIAAHGSAHVRA